MRSSNRPYLPRIDMLRGIAAWWVVLFHSVTVLPSGAATTTNWQGARNPLPLVAAGGWLAVTLFLVISGFTIASGLRDRDVQWRWFLAARWLRIAPLYLVILLIGLLVGAPTFPPVDPGASDTGGRVAAAVTLLPVPFAWTPVPWLATGWSVRIEFALYLVVPLLVFVLARYRPFAAIATLGLASALLLVVGLRLAEEARDVIYFGVPGRLPEFLVGFLIGYYLGRDSPWTRSRYLPWAAGAVLVVMGATTAHLGGEEVLSPGVRIAAWLLTIGACSAVVVWGAGGGHVGGGSGAGSGTDRRSPGTIPEITRRLGVWSYSTYLWHYAVIVLIAAPISVKLGERLSLASQPRLVVGIAITLAVTAVVSWLSFTLIESPFLRLRHPYVGPTERGGTGGGHAG